MVINLGGPSAERGFTLTAGQNVASAENMTSLNQH
jgi:hypothetical protein